jgi:hypothetical protein
MNQANAEVVQVDESDETKMSTPKQVMETVAQEIEKQIPDAKAIPYVMSYADGHASKTEGIVHIIRGNVNSAVRVRPAKRSDAGIQITHGGTGSIWDESNSKKVGNVHGANYQNVWISSSMMEKITSTTTVMDIANINDAIAKTVEHHSPVINWVTGKTTKVEEVSVRVQIQNKDQYDETNRRWASQKWDSVEMGKPKPAIPTQKDIIKIISQHDIEISIEGDRNIVISGNVSEIKSIIKRIEGNPLTDW